MTPSGAPHPCDGAAATMNRWKNPMLDEEAGVVPGNFVWSALTGPQHAFTQHRGGAARLRPEYGPFAAVRDWDDEHAWHDLAELVGPGGFFAVAGVGARVPAGWEVVLHAVSPQLVARHVEPAPVADAVHLDQHDASEMLELVARTKPGPFAERTVELGTYLGIRRNSSLVAMAGERFRAPGWSEISAVCTDPAYRRQGLATALVRTLVTDIRSRGSNAFLHVQAQNTGAIRLYESLGFVTGAAPTFIGARVPDSPRPRSVNVPETGTLIEV